jgi:hypothetical protein
MKKAICLMIAVGSTPISRTASTDEPPHTMASSVRWEVEVTDANSHEVKTFRLSQWVGKLPLPTNTTWTCSVVSPNGKTAVDIERSSDGTVWEQSGIECSRGDATASILALCITVSGGVTVPQALVHNSANLSVVSGHPILKGTHFTISCNGT